MQKYLPKKTQPKFTADPWAVREESRVYTFHCHDTISLRSNSFWWLKQGAVKTFTWSEAGTVTVLGYWGAGDIIGQALSSAEPYQIICLTDVEALCISQSFAGASCDRFKPAQHQWPILEAVYRSVQQTERLLCIMRTERMYQRLLKVLVWLAQKFGSPVKQGQLIELRLTHQELAELIGTTRVTVTRLLGQMEKEGLIVRPRSYCIVLSEQAE
ncbi:MAG: Crp/Fnr family transcriptional regulator [Cyanophyceae cyanobacterium]